MEATTDLLIRDALIPNRISISPHIITNLHHSSTMGARNPHHSGEKKLHKGCVDTNHELASTKC